MAKLTHVASTPVFPVKTSFRGERFWSGGAAQENTAKKIYIDGNNLQSEARGQR